MVDGVSGQNTVLAVRHAEEGYSTEPGPALIHRKRFLQKKLIQNYFFRRIVEMLSHILMLSRRR